MNWVLDADIRGFFDSMSHEWTMKFLEHRVVDRRILRLIRKWLKAGVSEDGQWSDTSNFLEALQRNRDGSSLPEPRNRAVTNAPLLASNRILFVPIYTGS